ncbi:MAG: hypothetical protein JNJ54_30195 [Myxococcaceae bacterium]|nr:hypothetical protein [Myxococcaceae bacterium]
MTDQERLAHDLAAVLRAQGLGGSATGGGVHWRVDLTTPGRAMRVHCFWYGASHGLLLGMNPANARARPRPTGNARFGPEYAATLREGAATVAEGRTGDAGEVVACARAWLAGCSRDELAVAAPFVDRLGRFMRAVAGRIDPRLGWELGGDPSYELWVHGEGRSCELKPNGEEPSCQFRIGQATVAFTPRLEDVGDATSAWLLERTPLSALPSRVPRASLEPHAEVLESDPARWHWLHMRERIADADDVLAELRPLHERLAASPIATRFFTYSSLNRLCFSASSHFPWVDPGLPPIAPAGDGRYGVGRDVLQLDDALARIEARLAGFPIPPFSGSAYHLEQRVLGVRLKALGSPLEPVLAPRGAWFDVVVPALGSTRRCLVTPRNDWTGQVRERAHLELIDGASTVSASWPSWDDAVAAVRCFCEDDAPLDEVLRAPGVEVQRRPA